MIKKMKLRTVEEIYNEMIEKHGCIPINLRFALDPEVDLAAREMSGLCDDLVRPSDNKEGEESDFVTINSKYVVQMFLLEDTQKG